MMRLALSLLLISAGSAIAADSDQVAMDLGVVIAAEEACGLAYDQAAIEAFVDKHVAADDMGFQHSQHDDGWVQVSIGPDGPVYRRRPIAARLGVSPSPTVSSSDPGFPPRLDQSTRGIEIAGGLAHGEVLDVWNRRRALRCDEHYFLSPPAQAFPSSPWRIGLTISLSEVKSTGFSFLAVV